MAEMRDAIEEADATRRGRRTTILQLKKLAGIKTKSSDPVERNSGTKMIMKKKSCEHARSLNRVLYFDV
jgi:hypothetical protein